MQLDKWCVGRPIHFHRICVKASMPPCTSPHAGAMPLPEFINGSQTRLLSSLSTGKSIITLKRRCYDDTQGRRDHRRITWNYKALIHIISRIHERGRNQRAARNRISRKKINEMLQNEFPADEISSSRELTLLFDVQAIRAIRLLWL